MTPQAQSHTMKLWAGNGKFRMEMQGGVVQIFRDQAFYTLNPAGKSYTRQGGFVTGAAPIEGRFAQPRRKTRRSRSTPRWRATATSTTSGR